MQRMTPPAAGVGQAQGELLWVADSAASRIVKWQLLHLGVPHSERVLDWQSLRADSRLAALNPKGQVPCWIEGDSALSDSLLIVASRFSQVGWLKSPDALRFRCADVELNASLQALYACAAEKSADACALLEKSACAAWDKALPGLRNLAYSAQAEAKLNAATPGWMALHVLGGFISSYAMQGGHAAMRERIVPLARVLAPLEELASFHALERSLAPYAPRIPARWCCAVSSAG